MRNRAITIGVAVCLVVAATGWIARARPLQTPGRSTRVAFDGGATSTAWLPIEIPRGGQAYVRGRVSGHEVPVLIDSGAGATVLDLSLAGDLGLPLGASLDVKGTVGATKGRLVRDVVIQIGSMRLGPLTAVALDLGGVIARLGRNPIILGRDMFESAVVDLDYPGMRVAFRDEAYSYDGPATALRMSRQGDKYQIDVTIADRTSTPIDIDTGSDSAVTLFDAFARRAGVPAAGARVSTSLIGGAGATAVVRVAMIPALAIGDVTLANIPVVFPPVTAGSSGSERTGTIGSEILRRFRVTFDAPHQRVYFAPAPGWDAAFRKNRLGLNVVLEKDGLRVAHVSLGSPAEAAGLKTGDLIRAVNGEPVSSEYWPAWLAASTGPAGTRVTLLDGSNHTRTLVLADYY